MSSPYTPTHELDELPEPHRAEVLAALTASEPEEAGKAPVTLSGSRCQCTVCGLYFNSDYAFQKHRVGLHMPGERRCLSPDEMLEKGMALVGSFWVSKRRPALTTEDAISSETVTHFSAAVAKLVPTLGAGRRTRETRSWRGGDLI